MTAPHDLTPERDREHVIDLFEVVHETLRWPPDTHHIGCDSRNGKACDCYAAGSNAAHAALDALAIRLASAEDNRDQWHSASNEMQEARDELLAVWDMSADVLGPEWNALAEKIEALR